MGILYFRLNIVYQKEIEEPKPKTDKAIAIEYGVSNFATIVVEGKK